MKLTRKQKSAPNLKFVAWHTMAQNCRHIARDVNWLQLRWLGPTSWMPGSTVHTRE